MNQLAPLPAAVSRRRTAITRHSRLRPDERVRVDGRRFRRVGLPFHVQGVTYGPFAPANDGTQFPVVSQVRDDFRHMASAGINAIRVYHVPPRRLLDLADAENVQVLIDIPWRKHLCFLDSQDAQREARRAVRRAAIRGRAHASVLAYSIGNEIPPDVVRWHGRGRVERFLAELVDVARQADPSGLVTYANFPPTEYLDPSPIDFATFNVYLHDRAAFRRYLFRLQNLVGDKPLVLGELGMDTIRQGEIAQADFLSGHIEETRLMGLAGAFTFSWTDDWHTGGHAIQDWAFGLTRADRSPKAALHALRDVFESTPAESLAKLLPRVPRVSVVVCSYNGSRTLEQCLSSLLVLDYPNYEVIVVDDGSTDNTPEILTRFPSIRAIRQTNQGLSVARNVGAQAATGNIVAYTDDDCFADPDWLTHLVYQLESSGAAAVGGPNLTPDDGWLASCVAASPGQPTHVLESDQEAEHIPGCNMAFRRDALLAINGFDPIFRQAGDDVDVCWRLQQAGQWITFAPCAFVWHHRRQSVRAYLRQQAGYGAAEAVLLAVHPEKFNGRGEGKWRGVLYGASLQGLRLGKSIIYRGTYATGLFQCIYQPGPAHWATLPSTLEWHLAAALIALGGLLSPLMFVAAGGMAALSILVAVLQAFQARMAPEYDGFVSRLVVAGLCYAQPLVRSWARYKRRGFGLAAQRLELPTSEYCRFRRPWSGYGALSYWTEEWRDRMELLRGVVSQLEALRWPKTIDTGWTDWDLELYCGPWTAVQICTTQEEHGGKKRLIRVRYRVRLREFAKAVVTVSLLLIIGAAFVHIGLATACTAALIAGLAMIWWRGIRAAAQLLRVIDGVASELRLITCPVVARSRS
jgi:GT2 family glycosyltransferase